MWSPPGDSVVRRAVELKYHNTRRAAALRWSALNAALLLLFAYDLWRKCPGYTSALHYAEVVCAGLVLASLLQHLRSLRAPSVARAAALSPTQMRLLGLRPADLDSSLSLSPDNGVRLRRSAGGGSSEDVLSLSLSPARQWGARERDDAPHSTSASPSPPAPRRSPPAHTQSPSHSHTHAHDEFIADHRTLDHYLRQQEAQSEREAQAAAARGWAPLSPLSPLSSLSPLSPRSPHSPHPPPPQYHLATVNTESVSGEEGGSEGVGVVGVCGSGGARDGSPAMWWRLHLDPARLTHFNLNLRLWLHLTILERLVREMQLADDALAAHGLNIKLGEVSVERLRAVEGVWAGAGTQLGGVGAQFGGVGAQFGGVGASAQGAGAPANTLLHFLEPFADQRYVVQRIRELSRGGCLSAYKWDGGGAEWRAGLPTDAEVVLALVGAYLDRVLPPPPRRPFTAAHVSLAPAPPPRSPAALLVRRVSVPPAPPHYALVVGEDTLEPARGRNNLWHTLLVFIAAAARADPPALRRLHLGPAGLNMLWIIGR